ncbi:MAG: hypothetical protein R2867_05375 [Caldilineaceae bacterium]
MNTVPETQKNFKRLAVPGPTSARQRASRVMIFYSLVFGILSNWLLTTAGPYIQDPTTGFDIGPPMAIVLRIVTSHITALLIFVAAYEKATKLCDETWMIYCYAFSTGFAWPIAMDLLSGTFF